MIASEDRFELFSLSIGIEGFFDLGQFSVNLFTHNSFPLFHLHILVDQDHTFLIKIFIGRKASHSNEMFPFRAVTLIIAPVTKGPLSGKKSSVGLNTLNEL